VDAKKVPQFNREAEQVVLGCALLESDGVMPSLRERLTPEHFYYRPHRLVYQALLDLFDRSEPIDLVTVGNLLEEKGQLAKVGGRIYLSELLNQVTTTTSVAYYAEIVAGKARQRDLILKTMELRELAEKGDYAQLDQQLAAMLAEATPIAMKLGDASSALDFPAGAMIGAAGDFARAYSEVVESPASYLFFAFLTALGALVGDRVALKGITRNPARLFTVLLGPTGLARKSTAMKLVLAFFAKVFTEFSVIRGVGSAEGLAKVIQDRKLTNALLYLDELRAFVDKAKIDGSVLLALVNSLFEDSCAENHTKSHSIELQNVHLSLLSACTLETFSHIFDRNFMAIGFPNRLLLVLDDAKDRKPVPGEVAPEIEISLAGKLATILRDLASYSAANPLLVGLTPEAETIWAEFYNALPRTMAAVRLDQIALRIAMLLAISSGKHEIDAEVIQATIDIARWELAIREEYLPLEASNAIAAMEQKIRQKLKTRGPLRERDLKRLTNANRDGIWVFDTARENLERANEIVFDPKSRVYRLVKSEITSVDGTCHQLCRQVQNEGLAQTGSGVSDSIKREGAQNRAVGVSLK
jgi:hypothetical protein